MCRAMININILFVFVMVIAIISCSPQRVIQSKEISKNGISTNYSYYLTSGGEEVLHGKRTTRTSGFLLEEKYRDGKLQSSRMSTRSR